MNNFLTGGVIRIFISSIALANLKRALSSVSSTIMRTCKSSSRCSKFGWPLFSSSYGSKEYAGHVKIPSIQTGHSPWTLISPQQQIQIAENLNNTELTINYTSDIK